MPSDLDIRVSTPRKNYGYQEAIALDISIKNVSSKGVFLVMPDRYYQSGPPYVWKLGNSQIGVMLAEDELPPGFCYYGYNPPALQPLPAHRSRKIRLSIGMPPKRGQITNNYFELVETPVTGKTEIIVTVGYLRKKFAPRTLAPWAEFLALQKKTKPVSIPVYVA